MSHWLLGTRLRRKLLSYSFSHPTEEFYVRELAGLIEEDPGNLSRELKRLEKEGLFNSSCKGREKFFSVNKRYPLYPELKSFVFKTEGIAGRLKGVIEKYKGVSLAFIFGSYAKGEENKASDVDLILVGEFPLGEWSRDIRRLESEFNREINFSFFSEEDFVKEREKKGGFLNVVLKDKIVLLKGFLNV